MSVHDKLRWQPLQKVQKLIPYDKIFHNEDYKETMHHVLLSTVTPVPILINIFMYYWVQSPLSPYSLKYFMDLVHAGVFLAWD